MTDIQPDNIFVTGGFGFIGSHLVKSLIKKKEGHIILLDNLTYASNINTLKDLDKSCYTHLNIDIGDCQDFSDICKKYNPIKIFHLAAESHVDRSIDGPNIFIKTNVEGTFNILNGVQKYLSESKDKNNFKIIYISTDEVYGDIKKGKSSESDILLPNSPYSSSKASSDLLVRAWHKTYGLPVITTRCTNNYGSWQFPEKLIPLSIGKMLNYNNIPIYGDGSQIRDWIHVQDHVDALINISNSSEKLLGEIYNIGSGNEFSNLDLITKICLIMDEILPNKNGSYLDLISFVEDRPGHDMRYSLNINKIKNELGWSPKISFDDGIRDTIQWYIANFSTYLSNKEGIYDGSRIGTLGKNK